MAYWRKVCYSLRSYARSESVSYVGKKPYDVTWVDEPFLSIPLEHLTISGKCLYKALLNAKSRVDNLDKIKP